MRLNQSHLKCLYNCSFLQCTVQKYHNLTKAQAVRALWKFWSTNQCCGSGHNMGGNLQCLGLEQMLCGWCTVSAWFCCSWSITCAVQGWGTHWEFPWFVAVLFMPGATAGFGFQCFKWGLWVGSTVLWPLSAAATFHDHKQICCPSIASVLPF